MEDISDTEALELGVSSANMASYVAVTQVIASAISAVMIIALARLLAPTQYGIYTLAYGVSAFFGAFGISGMGHYLNRYIPYRTARKEKLLLEHDLGTSIFALFLIGLAAVVIGVALSGLISTYAFHSSGYTFIVDLSLITIVPTIIMFLEYNALIGFKDGPGSAITYVAGNLGMAIGSIGLVILGYGVAGALIGMIAGALVGVLFGTAEIMKHSRIRIEFKGMRKRMDSLFAFSMPIAGSTIITGMLNSFSILLLGVFSMPSIVGSFGIAYRIGTVILTVMAFVGSVLVQMFTSAMVRGRSTQRVSKLYNYSIYFGAVLTVPIVACLVSLANPFVISVFPGYKSATLYIPAMAISILVGIIGVYASSLAISIKAVNKVLKYAVITGVVQLVLLFALVPAFNAYGVIIGVYLAGSLVSNYLYVRYMEREPRIKTDLRRVYMVLFAGILMAIVLLPINLLPVSQTAQLLAGIVATIIIYPILLGITGAIGKRELEILDELSKRVPIFGDLLRLSVSYTSVFTR